MSDIKNLDPDVYPAPREDEEALTTVGKDWTKEEERRAKLKLDLIIMPLMTLGFFCLRGLSGGELADSRTGPWKHRQRAD